MRCISRWRMLRTPLADSNTDVRSRDMVRGHGDSERLGARMQDESSAFKLGRGRKRQGGGACKVLYASAHDVSDDWLIQKRKKNGVGPSEFRALPLALQCTPSRPGPHHPAALRLVSGLRIDPFRALPSTPQLFPHKGGSPLGLFPAAVQVSIGLFPTHHHDACPHAIITHTVTPTSRDALLTPSTRHTRTPGLYAARSSIFFSEGRRVGVQAAGGRPSQHPVRPNSESESSSLHDPARSIRKTGRSAVWSESANSASGRPAALSASPPARWKSC
jgi:hypothetical protein